MGREPCTKIKLAGVAVLRRGAPGDRDVNSLLCFWSACVRAPQRVVSCTVSFSPATFYCYILTSAMAPGRQDIQQGGATSKLVGWGG